MARMSIAITVAIASDGFIFGDDYGYLKMANEYQLGETESWAIFDTWNLWRVNSGFLWPISAVFRLFGFHPILGQTLSALAGTTVAVAVAFLVRRNSSTMPALFSGLAVALFPSQILWSSLVLKDAYSWMALVLIALAHGWWSRQVNRVQFYQGLILLAGLSYWLVHLRVHTFIVASIAGVGAALFTSGTRKIMRAISLLALLLIIPTTVGSSYFAWNVLSLGSNPAQVRFNMALGARTAMAPPTTGAIATTGTFDLEAVIKIELSETFNLSKQESESIVDSMVEAFDGLSLEQVETMSSLLAAESADLTPEEIRDIALIANSAVRESLSRQASGLPPEKVSRKSSLSDLFAEVPSDLTTTQMESLSASIFNDHSLQTGSTRNDAALAGNDAAPADNDALKSVISEISYMPTGIRVMLLDPLPQHLERSPNMKYAFAEHLVWYPLLLLAGLGIGRYWRELSTELAYTLLVFCGLVAMWGLAEGNFGTAWRHRGELVWVVAVFAGLGLEAAREILLNRREKLTAQIAS